MGRQTVSGLIFSRGGSSLTVREHKSEDGRIKYCNRVGCSASVYQIRKPEKSRSSDVQSQSGSSSKSFPWNFRKSQWETQTRTTSKQATIVEKCSRHARLEKSDSNVSSLKSSPCCTKSKEKLELNQMQSINRTVPSEPSELEVTAAQGSSENGSKRSRNSAPLLDSKVSKNVSKQPRSTRQSNSGASTRSSPSSKNASEAPKNASEASGIELQTNGSKSIIRSAISNVIPSVFSSSEAGVGKRVSTIRKRSSVGDSLPAKIKSSIASSSNKNSGSLQRIVSRISTPGNLSRRTLKNDTQSPNTGALSVRTSRVPSRETGMALSQQVDYSILSPDSTNNTQQSQSEETYPESSSRYSVERDLSFFTGRINQTPLDEPLHAPVADRSAQRQLNLEGTAETLMTLERIEQDEDVSYEHLLILGNNLINDGLSSYDQHRDMRMDIDNMSYEELLALEERIGTVSTALTEEALTQCLKRINYKPSCPVFGNLNHEVEVRCIICQEEYVDGEELGKLICSHSYHVNCIHQWLQLKNWCPICKASLSSTS